MSAVWTTGVAIDDWVSWVALGGVALWLLVGEPLTGRHAYRRMRATLAGGDGGVRRQFYRNWTWQGWALTWAVLAVALGIFGWSPAALGLRWPHLALNAGDGFTAGFLGGVVGALIVALVGGVVFGLWLARHKQDGGEQSPRQPARPRGDVLALLPRTGRERRGFALLALTAGIGEEVVWRGFLLAALVALLPHVSVWWLLVPMALIFGLAHLYQGWIGMLVTAALGALLGALYLATGSLLLPMLVHVAIDLRALLIRVPTTAPPPATARPGS